jgi:N-acetylmuramoyl-L-alanine amidase
MTFRLLFAGLALTTPALAEPPLAGVVIVVDPGHGGQRYSKSYTGGTRGVRSSREGSSNVEELHARIDFFEHYNCHFFLSVHHNAGPPTATGHTCLYKHNAADDTLYESLAHAVNDALEGAVPGPKNKLIKGSYHILRETDIPGTISESGFMTNKDFDELSNKPDYPKTEAAAICMGAVRYWTEHKPALVALRDKLAKERAAKPRDPKTYTAIALNPEYQERMKELLAKVAPAGKYDPAKVGEYVAAFKKVVVTDPKATFTVTATFDGKAIKLAGAVSDRRYHDRLIDMLVAMRLYAITNEVKVPKEAK